MDHFRVLCHPPTIGGKCNWSFQLPTTRLGDRFVNAEYFGEASSYSEVLTGSSGRVSHAQVAKVALPALVVSEEAEMIPAPPLGE